MTNAQSTMIHSVIILPGATVKYFCKDGLSSLTFYHIQQILNFGGKLKAINCGAGNEFTALYKAMHDMYDTYFKYGKAYAKPETNEFY